jgi:hypothetical protein
MQWTRLSGDERGWVGLRKEGSIKILLDQLRSPPPIELGYTAHQKEMPEYFA